MFKINKGVSATYSEVPQANALRWTLLLKEEDGSFSPQSGKIKCRDFFNDLVAKHEADYEFSIYSFKNKVKWNSEGMYFLLENIYDNTQFNFKIEQIINAKIEKDLGKEHTLRVITGDKGSCLLLVPHIFFTKTYYISLITILIRISNYEYNVTSFEDYFKPESPLVTIEHLLSLNQCKHLLENGFKVPKDTEDFWYYYTVNQNSKAAQATWSIYNIHNCGIRSWMLAAKIV